MKSYDVIVVGGGPGGYVAAIRAAQLGLRVALVEKDSLGGVCLNWGCIPTKALLRCAEVVSLLSQGDEFGFHVEDVQTDYARAQARSREVSGQLVKGIASLMRKNRVEVISGTGVLRGAHRVDAAGEELTAAAIIWATGTAAAAPLGLSFDHPRVLSPRKALELTKMPRSIAILGAGAIGMEFATLWQAYGVEVTIVEMADRILPLADADVSAELQKAYGKRGIALHVGTKITAVQSGDRDVTLVLEKDGKCSNLTAELLLVAAGVRPNTAGLEQVGVALDRRGYVVVDDCMRTNVSGLYAIGDITGKLALAHVASAQGIVAAETCAGLETNVLDYAKMPSCVYSVPEAAQVGMTEEGARKAGFEVKTARFPFRANGRALAAGESEGFVKLVTDAKTGEILGTHMVGGHVTEMIAGTAGLLALECTAEELARIVHPHPSMSEAIMEAAHGIGGGFIHI